jgi:hypothetical protein
MEAPLSGSSTPARRESRETKLEKSRKPMFFQEFRGFREVLSLFHGIGVDAFRGCGSARVPLRVIEVNTLIYS